MAAALLSGGIPLGGEIGLQLLLAPASSSIIVRGACTVVGVGVPVYSSFKALESGDENEMRTWLTYWAVYGSMTVVESTAEKFLLWIPFYHHLKLGLLIWLQLPLYDGAMRTFHSYIRPVLRRHQRALDHVISSGRLHLSTFLERHSREISTVARFVLSSISAVLRAVVQTLKGLGSGDDDGSGDGGNGQGLAEGFPPPQIQGPENSTSPSAPPSLRVRHRSHEGSGGRSDQASPGGEREWIHVQDPSSIATTSSGDKRSDE